MVSLKYLEGYHVQVGVNEINLILEDDMKQWVYIVRKHIMIGHQETFPNNIGCSTVGSLRRYFKSLLFCI